MPNFSYYGKNELGDAVSGFIDGKDEMSVSKSLIQSNILPIKIKEIKQNNALTTTAKIKTKDLLVFTRQMYVFIKAGVPLSKALKTISNVASKKALSMVFKDIHSDVESGYTLSSAMQKHPQVFNSFYVNMVRIGESTGKTEETFSQLYEYIEFEQDMKKNAVNALRYPALVIIAVIIAFFIMMTMVIPAFAETYSGFGAELPWQTLLLISISDFIVKYFIIIFIFIVGVGVLFKKFLNTSPGKMWWDEFHFQIPILGPILKKIILARFSKSFSMSLQSGIPVVQSLGYIAPALNNSYMFMHIEKIRQNIEKGLGLYQALRASSVFDPFVLEMYLVGEESGDLDGMTKEVASFYEKEVAHQLKNINTLIEPILLVFLGGLILIFALGIFLPIWDLATVVN